MKTVFVIEDDEHIQELLRYNLEKEHYEVTTFMTAEAMFKVLEIRTPDIFLLDLMLPGMDGLEACKLIRRKEKFDTTPIIMLTAKGEEADVVSGLELGADDYIIKPFSPRVLLARIKAALRRKAGRELPANSHPLTIAGLQIHPGRHELLIDGLPLILTASEFKALYLLASNPGWVYSRDQIVDAVHGHNYPVTDRSVDVMIAGLRKKMGTKGDLIDTVRGIGYRFTEGGSL